MKLTLEKIKKLNNNVPYRQGIFIEPFGILSHIKEHVVYTKYETANRGGNCWDDKNTINETMYISPPKDKFEILNDLLAIICPTISFLTYNQIESFIQSNEETNYGYYGDYTTDTIEYILLSDIYKLL